VGSFESVPCIVEAKASSSAGWGQCKHPNDIMETTGEEEITTHFEKPEDYRQNYTGNHYQGCEVKH